MEQVFKKLIYVSPFQDDILICGKDEEEYAKHLNEALQQARRNNVKLNINKAKIAMTELKFLGHAISGDKVKPDPEKVKAIVEMQSPKSKKELQRLLGMTNYLSKFVDQYSTITAPLRALLQKETAWVRTPSQQQAFEKLKAAIVKAPTLGIYEASKPLYLQTDASNVRVGGCLLQENISIAYTSASLTQQ